MIVKNFDQIFQLRNLIIASIIFGFIKLTQQILTFEYFHDFKVYLSVINLLNELGNPYFQNWSLPYLYPPLVTKFLQISNITIFKFTYLFIYFAILIFCYFFINKIFKISFLITFGISGIFIKSIMTGNISNIFYLLMIITLFIYIYKKISLPYYLCVFLMSIVKFNFLILILLPLLTSKNFKIELINFIFFSTVIAAIYAYQYVYMNIDFLNFIYALKERNAIDNGWSIYSILNYSLKINPYISILIHTCFFSILLLMIIINKKKINHKLFILLVLIILIFLNPRLKLYDVAYGIILLNIAIIFLHKDFIINFYIFNIFYIFLIKSFLKIINFNYYQPEILAWIICLSFSYFLIKNKSFHRPKII